MASQKTYRFALIDKTLTDSSHVFDVVVMGPWDARFPCVSLRDADAFMNKLRSAITEHTNEIVENGYRMGFEREI